MADYLALLQRRQGFLQRLDDSIKDANENREKEDNAATIIQRLFRGVCSRIIINKKNYAANEVQRCFRGHRGRKECRRRRREKAETRRMFYLHYLVGQLQRCFRGYYSRKYKQDHARRKQYCRMIEEKGRVVLEGMEKYFLDQAENLADEARQKREQEFKNLAQNLHHLMSTQHIRGVYNPVTHFVEQPTMNRLPVEEHIRGVVKDLLRTRGIAKKASTLVPDNQGTLKIPLKGQKYRLSLQASAPYDAVQQAAKQEKVVHKLLVSQITGQPADAAASGFLAGGKTNLLESTSAQPMAVGEPYLDPWANPMLVKGVPQDQKQLLESARTHKALFAAPVTTPFLTRVGGNHSTALPNDVFDVVAEAQQTGGAIQRHRGTKTLRFGLPDSADARYMVAEEASETYKTFAANQQAQQEQQQQNWNGTGTLRSGNTGSYTLVKAQSPFHVTTTQVQAHANVIGKAPLRTSSTMRSTTRRVRNYSETGRHFTTQSRVATAQSTGATLHFADLLHPVTNLDDSSSSGHNRGSQGNGEDSSDEEDDDRDDFQSRDDDRKARFQMGDDPEEEDAFETGSQHMAAY